LSVHIWYPVLLSVSLPYLREISDLRLLYEMAPVLLQVA